jgi:hypothetical protein
VEEGEIARTMNLNILPGKLIFLRFDPSGIHESHLHEIQSNDFIAQEQPDAYRIVLPNSSTQINKIILGEIKYGNNGLSGSELRCGNQAET